MEKVQYRSPVLIDKLNTSAPQASARSSSATGSHSSALQATWKMFETMTSACGAMHRMTPATNVPCPAYGGIVVHTVQVYPGRDPQACSVPSGLGARWTPFSHG